MKGKVNKNNIEFIYDRSSFKEDISIELADGVEWKLTTEEGSYWVKPNFKIISKTLFFNLKLEDLSGNIEEKELWVEFDDYSVEVKGNVGNSPVALTGIRVELCLSDVILNNKDNPICVAPEDLLFTFSPV